MNWMLLSGAMKADNYMRMVPLSLQLAKRALRQCRRQIFEDDTIWALLVHVRRVALNYPG
jgi:hypothetical protein